MFGKIGKILLVALLFLGNVQCAHAAQLVVSWGLPASNDATGFVLERASLINGTFAQLADVTDGTATSYVDGNLSNQMSYCYRSYAYNANGSSDYSNTDCAITDTAPPTVSISTPSANATVSGSSAAVTAGANDCNGINNVQFKLDGANLNTPVTALPYTTSWNTTSASNGSHSLTAVAMDNAGNTATSAAVAVTVSNTVSTVNFGLTTIGGALDDSDSNNISLEKITTGSQSVAISSMSAYVGPVGSAPNNQFQFAIYTNTNSKPGTLVANSASGTLVANSWNTKAITATLAANTTYWLGYNTNGVNTTVNNLYYNVGASGSGAYSSTTAFGTWPTTFTSTLSVGIYSMYATGQ